MIEILLTILSGVFSGVASGLILWKFFGKWTERQDSQERRNQIKHIAKVIEHWRKEIFSVKESFVLKLLPKSEMGPRATEILRDSYHKIFRIELASALNQHCTKLSYDEVEEVRKIFLRQFEAYPELTVSKGRLELSFRTAESIRWLGLKPLESDQASGT